MKTAPKRAPRAAIRTSQASAMAKPPPTAAPLTAAIHGLRERWIDSLTVAI